MLIKLPNTGDGVEEKAAALLTPFIDEEVATRLAGEETDPENRHKLARVVVKRKTTLLMEI